MFTGIIEGFGEVKKLIHENENLHITMDSHLTPELKVDQSVAHNGVCLTVIAIEGTQDLVAGTNSGELEKYKALIQQKIYQNVNKQLCGLDPLELIFEIVLMPTGDLIGGAKMIKSSKIESCDQAVERAILQAQPLPMPQDNRLFLQLKKLKLKFQPNGPIN